VIGALLGLGAVVGIVIRAFMDVWHEKSGSAGVR
jgi:hypothetical protein